MAGEYACRSHVGHICGFSSRAWRRGIRRLRQGAPGSMRSAAVSLGTTAAMGGSALVVASMTMQSAADSQPPRCALLQHHGASLRTLHAFYIHCSTAGGIYQAAVLHMQTLQSQFAAGGGPSPHTRVCVSPQAGTKAEGPPRLRLTPTPLHRHPPGCQPAVLPGAVAQWGRAYAVGGQDQLPHSCWAVVAPAHLLLPTHQPVPSAGGCAGGGLHLPWNSAATAPVQLQRQLQQGAVGSGHVWDAGVRAPNGAALQQLPHGKQPAREEASIMMVTAAAADHHQRHHHHGLSTAGHQQQHCFACGGPVLTFGSRSPLLLLLAPSLTLAPWLTPTHSATPLSLSLPRSTAMPCTPSALTWSWWRGRSASWSLMALLPWWGLRPASC